MRRKTIAVAIAVAAALGAGVAVPAAAAPHAGAPHTRQRVPANAEALRQAIAGLPDAGATAAQVRFGGKDGSWAGTSGEADLRTHRAPKGDERFRAGSITKAFTAATALQLVHEGKLSLDGTVQRYLPGLLPAHYPDVTVGQLLNYTSGLPSADGSFESDLKERFTSWDHRELVQRAFTKPMNFTPGTRQEYSNIGYNVLGLLIEKATGHSYEREVRERVIDRAGLKDTYSPGDAAGIRGRHTHGYQLSKGELFDATEWNQSITWASGDLITTTADLERFTSALFRGRVVPKAELELMFTVPDVPAYGKHEKAAYTSGLTRIELGDTVVWGKSGGRYGYLNGFGATRDLSRTLVYSVNATEAKSEKGTPVVGKIIKAAFGS
ncbi:serine hydrolase [Streptomyces sp. ISL-11]|uniref:serine hydrolase domain-containing protein n=1 Tax=Streptomyces sp. ISL-11 TaxID=2819174 RepID=UPI001BE6EDB0|nr:serine hydrolase domain-containing protein [Streptomyces sp. ISL-11]MBT2386218.1 beta-lactamase family protein [Streptomyces sp. ISL-11]